MSATPTGGEALWRLLCSRISGARRPADPAAALEPIRRLLEALGQPQKGLASIHIAGSKGKGSTATFCDALLRGQGLRTGLFLSPHLSDWRERFQIDGAFAADQLLDEAAAVLARVLQDPAHDRAGFFDLATAAALWLFRRAGVDCAVIETGIGGARDATNLVEPRVCAITSVELEHCEQLGHTHQAIAREKAGIIKPGVPVVTGPLCAAAEAEVADRARRSHAPLYRLPAAPSPLLTHLGEHAALNAALARVCVELSGLTDPQRLAADADAILGRTPLPGRCEVLSRQPTLIVDSAHTLDSARALSKALAAYAQPRRWVLSLKADKQPGPFLETLLQAGDQIYFTRADAEYSLRGDTLLQHLPAQLRARLDACSIEDPHQALRLARSELPADWLLCATGSVYLAGLARQVWRPAASPT